MTLSSAVFSSVFVGIGRGLLSTCGRELRQAEKRAKYDRPQTSRLAACVTNPTRLKLSDRDFARLDLLRLRQSQAHDALLDLRADLVGIDRRIELERTPEIFRARFAVEQSAFDGGDGAPADDGELVVLDP